MNDDGCKLLRVSSAKSALSTRSNIFRPFRSAKGARTSEASARGMPGEGGSGHVIPSPPPLFRPAKRGTRRAKRAAGVHSCGGMNPLRVSLRFTRVPLLLTQKGEAAQPSPLMSKGELKGVHSCGGMHPLRARYACTRPPRFAKGRGRLHTPPAKGRLRNPPAEGRLHNPPP